MIINHLQHKWGGAITELTAIWHDTLRSGKAVWGFEGVVRHNDGSKTRREISPDFLCYDPDDADGFMEFATVSSLLDYYLMKNGEWIEDGRVWKPHAKRGREKLA
jgi:hypothetical protein